MHEPTPVVALNWAVVLAELGHAEQALKKLDAIHDDLKGFQPWHAARADVLVKLGRPEAGAAYDAAIATAPNPANRLFLERKRAALDSANEKGR
jgi:RNA polymerase sigma-70 factor (ECF subfamily)